MRSILVVGLAYLFASSFLASCSVTPDGAKLGVSGCSNREKMALAKQTNPEYGRYGKDAFDKILIEANNKFIRERLLSSGYSGNVRFKTKIDRLGRVQDIHLLRASGNQRVDQLIAKLVEKTDFPKFDQYDLSCIDSIAITRSLNFQQGKLVSQGPL